MQKVKFEQITWKAIVSQILNYTLFISFQLINLTVRKMNKVKILVLLVLFSTFITQAVLQQFEKKLVLEDTWSSLANTSANRQELT